MQKLAMALIALLPRVADQAKLGVDGGSPGMESQPVMEMGIGFAVAVTGLAEPGLMAFGAGLGVFHHLKPMIEHKPFLQV